MFLSFNKSVLVALLIVIGVFSVRAQDTKPTPAPKPAAKPGPTPDLKSASLKPTSADQIVETSLFVYGLGGGRKTLNQIRKTTFERGRTNYTAADGKVEPATYRRFTIRGEKLAKEKVRLDQEYPSAKYSLVFNEDKIYGVYNNSVFAPREDASNAFEYQIVHGVDALLRYKENESAIDLGDREKIMGVEYFVITVTDKAQHKTRFFVSARSFRVMMLMYEEGGVRYRRKFYDYNYAQGTLVPYRTVLWANDKIVEETEVGTVTFGQKVDEELFKTN